MIYVTHDQVEAMTLADKIVVLKMARLCRQVRQWIVSSSKNLFVAGSLGAIMNFRLSISSKLMVKYHRKSDAIAQTVVNAQGRSFAVGDKQHLACARNICRLLMHRRPA